MADNFHLEVATPQRLLVDEDITTVQVPGKSGYMGILAGHAPLVSALGAGLLTYSGGSSEQSLVIAGGFVEISDNHVRVLADKAEAVKDVNSDAARKDLEEASKALREAKTEEETDQALEASQRAQARLDAASTSQGH